MPHQAKTVQPTPEPPYHVVATDMDGTLLNADHEVSPYTKATIQRLITHYQLPPKPSRTRQRRASDAGAGDGDRAVSGTHFSDSSASENEFRVFFVIASGRHVHDLSYILRELELPDYSGYIVSSNGAKAHCIVHTHSNEASKGDGDSRKNGELEEVYTAFLLPSQVGRLLRLLPDDEEEININLYTSQGWSCSLDWRDELRYYRSGFAYTLFSPREKRQQYEAFLQSQQEAGGSDPVLPCENYDDHPANPLYGVEKLYFGTDNLGRLQQLYRIVTNQEDPATVLPYYTEPTAQPQPPFTVTTTFSSPYCMEMTARGVTKTAGIEHLMPYLASRSDSVCNWNMGGTCIAFGDGENDVHMLRSAARGCLMGNAGSRVRELLKDAANVEEVGSNVEDGVARKLVEVFKLASHGQPQPPIPRS